MTTGENPDPRRVIVTICCASQIGDGVTAPMLGVGPSVLDEHAARIAIVRAARRMAGSSASEVPAGERGTARLDRERTSPYVSRSGRLRPERYAGPQDEVAMTRPANTADLA